jgi:uncharacterized protein (DUF924 family)
VTDTDPPLLGATTSGAPHDPTALLLDVWRRAGRGRWFKADPSFDDQIAQLFSEAYWDAVAGRLKSLGARPEGSLALILLLDQVPRHLFRDQASAFASDASARDAADQALARGDDRQLELDLQPFFYLPFGHHEDAASQDRCVCLLEAYIKRGGAPDYLRAALRRRAIIARFSRFPQRNAALGRSSNSAEEAFLRSRRP